MNTVLQCKNYLPQQRPPKPSGGNRKARSAPGAPPFTGRPPGPRAGPHRSRFQLENLEDLPFQGPVSPFLSLELPTPHAGVWMVNLGCPRLLLPPERPSKLQRVASTWAGGTGGLSLPGVMPAPVPASVEPEEILGALEGQPGQDPSPLPW